MQSKYLIEFASYVPVPSSCLGTFYDPYSSFLNYRFFKLHASQSNFYVAGARLPKQIGQKLISNIASCRFNVTKRVKGLYNLLLYIKQGGYNQHISYHACTNKLQAAFTR